MDKFAHVYFGPEEANRQREFLLAMNNVGIIRMSRDEIEEWYERDLKAHTGSDNQLVLHGEEEVKRFELVMQTFFKEKKYEVTDRPGSKEFKKWLDRKRRARATA